LFINATLKNNLWIFEYIVKQVLDKMNNMKNLLLIILTTYIVISITQCADMEGLYVLRNENTIDSIYINDNAQYSRVFFTKNEKKVVVGEWFIDGNHIGFDNWNNENKLLEYWAKDSVSVYFSIGRNLFLKPQKIYFDHNKYHYYERTTKLN
jgi:hypothetical protein